jgi:hypothetical protein
VGGGERQSGVWNVCEDPWKLEEKFISTLYLPLNLDQNKWSVQLAHVHGSCVLAELSSMGIVVGDS